MAILLVEPQCRGDEHVEVNAALLLTVREAFPGRPVIFCAEQDHLAAVRERVGEGSAALRFETIEIPPRSLSEPRRLRQDAALVKSLIDYSRSAKVTDLFLCSATSAAIYSLKWYSRLCRNLAVTVILHRNLASVVSVESFRPWHYLFRVKLALLCPGGKAIRYLVYGDFIRNRIRQVMPRLLPRLMAINHPYRFDAALPAPPEAGPVLFGFLGTGRFDKGSDLFFRLARDIGSAGPAEAARFLVVGHLWDPRLQALLPANVELASRDGGMLGRRRYRELACSLSYAVFCGQAEPYHYFASGALLDAFAFCRPVISLRTPMIEYCFREMGDIGYLCDSYQEMLEVAGSLLQGVDTLRYRLQCDNIRKNRMLFSPELVAGQLRDEYLRFQSEGAA